MSRSYHKQQPEGKERYMYNVMQGTKMASYHCGRADSLENSQNESELSLSCEFLSFESSWSEVKRDSTVVEPYQY